EGEEVGRGVAAQRRPGKVRVGREEPLGGGVQIGEVAAAAARDEDLAAGRLGTLDDEDPASALAGLRGAHQPGGAGAENDDVVGLAHRGGQAEAATARISSASSSPANGSQSPGAAPSIARASGALNDSSPAAGSASSSPTRRKALAAPRRRTVTVVPNSTLSPAGGGAGSAETWRAFQ